MQQAAFPVSGLYYEDFYSRKLKTDIKHSSPHQYEQNSCRVIGWFYYRTWTQQSWCDAVLASAGSFEKKVKAAILNFTLTFYFIAEIIDLFHFYISYQQHIPQKLGCGSLGLIRSKHWFSNRRF